MLGRGELAIRQAREGDGLARLDELSRMSGVASLRESSGSGKDVVLKSTRQRDSSNSSSLRIPRPRVKFSVLGWNFGGKIYGNSRRAFSGRLQGK